MTYPMAKDTTNPFANPIYELEDYEYELRATLALLNTQISLSESDKIPLDFDAVCYLYHLLLQRSEKITEVFNALHNAYCSTKPFSDALQCDRRALS